MLGRRRFVQLAAGVAGGLLLPAPGLVTGEEAVRRFWALDNTMTVRWPYTPLKWDYFLAYDPGHDGPPTLVVFDGHRWAAKGPAW